MRDRHLTDDEKKQMDDLIEETLLINFFSLLQKGLSDDGAGAKLHHHLKQGEKHVAVENVVPRTESN